MKTKKIVLSLLTIFIFAFCAITGGIFLSESFDNKQHSQISENLSADATTERSGPKYTDEMRVSTSYYLYNKTIKAVSSGNHSISYGVDTGEAFPLSNNAGLGKIDISFTYNGQSKNWFYGEKGTYTFAANAAPSGYIWLGWFRVYIEYESSSSSMGNSSSTIWELEFLTNSTNWTGSSFGYSYSYSESDYDESKDEFLLPLYGTSSSKVEGVVPPEPARSSFYAYPNGGTLSLSRTSISTVRVTNYGWGFKTNSAGFFESQNQYISSSYAMMKISFNASSSNSTFTINYISYGESNYDYAIFSYLDSSLSQSSTCDSSYYTSTYGQSSPEERSITYSGISSGSHYIYVKYIKDGSVNQYNDSLQLFFQADFYAAGYRFSHKGLRYGSLPTVNRTGYTFDGWYTSATGGTRIYQTSIFTGSSIYAHWTAKIYQVDVNILSPSGEQNYTSGTMTYENSYSGKKYTGISDQPENDINYKGVIKIYDISPATGLYLSEVTTTKGNGSLVSSGGTYTYTFNYSGTPVEGWDDEINIKMATESYGMSFDWNNGSCNEPTSRGGILYGTSFKFPVPTRDGYVYQGFTGKGAPNAVKEFIVPDLGDSDNTHEHYETYTAQWQPINYTISYNVDGGNALSNSSYNADADQNSIKSLPSTTKLGYNFAGWKVDASSGNWVQDEVYSAGSSVQGKYGNVSLTAQWTAKECTLTARANYGSIPSTSGWTGSGSTATKKVAFDSTYGTLPVPTRKYYNFLGWYTEGGSAVTSSTKMTTEGATVYDHWEITWAMKASSSFGGGTGTKENPYQIKTAEQLAYLSKMVCGGNSCDGKYFIQTAHINLAKTSTGSSVSYVWLPIGNSTTAFSGNYDGQGFSIQNLKTPSKNSSTSTYNSYCGLFGKTTNALIENINLLSGTIYGTDYTGAIIGYMNCGSIKNCRNNVAVSGSRYCGLVGYATNASITSCCNYGTISGGYYVGGIVGKANSSDMENCYSKCSVLSNKNALLFFNGMYAGGLAGEISGTSTITACGVNGKVSKSAVSKAKYASLVGNSASTSSTIRDCFVIITGTEDLGWYNGSVTINTCISQFSTGSNKKYTGSGFSNWALTIDGQPLPAEFFWIGHTNIKINESKIKSLGYTK